MRVSRAAKPAIRARFICELALCGCTRHVATLGRSGSIPGPFMLINMWGFALIGIGKFMKQPVPSVFRPQCPKLNLRVPGRPLIYFKGIGSTANVG